MNMRPSVPAAARVVGAIAVTCALLTGCLTPAVDGGLPDRHAEATFEGAVAETSATSPAPLPGREHPVLEDGREFRAGVRGGSLRVPIAPDSTMQPGVLDDANIPSSLNPATALWTPAETRLLRTLFCAPVESDPLTGRWVAKLAERFDVLDHGRAIEVRLREGLAWSDGTPLTVSDVLFSYRRVYLTGRVENPTPDVFDRLGRISVNRTGRCSYRVRAERADPAIWSVVSLIPLPRHVVEPFLERHGVDAIARLWPTDGGESGFVGSGPFVPAETDPYAFVRLVPNPFYYETDPAGTQLPYLDELVFVAAPSQFAHDLYRERRIDVVAIDTPIGEQRVDDVRIDDEHYVLRSRFAASGGTALMLNQSVPTEDDPYGVSTPAAGWFGNDEFLRALAHLVDRRAINDDLFNGTGAVMTVGQPAQAPFAFDASEALPAFDPAAARDALDELGWVDSDGDGVREDEDGNPLRIEVLAPPRADRETLHTVLAARFRLAGVELVPLIVPPSEFSTRLTSVGDWEAATIMTSHGIAGIHGSPEESLFGLRTLPRRNYPPPDPTAQAIGMIADRLGTTVDQDAAARLFQAAELLLALRGDCHWLVQHPRLWAARRPYRNMLPRVANDGMWSFERVFLPREYHEP